MKGIIVEKDGTIHLADDIPMPEPGPYEALVKIESCMICNGTDMEIIRGELPEAQILSLIHISEPTRPCTRSRMPSSA